jgi:glycerophosphoryl diester phosphodiesterase
VEEALDFAVTHCIRLLLDIKDARLDTVLLLQAIRSRGAEDLVIFGVRTPKQLATVNDAGPNLQTLLFTQSPTAVDRYLEGGVDAIRLWPIWIRSQPELVRRIQEAGVEVWVSTGDLDGEELKSVIEMGVDGLITDRPQAALAYRAARSR